MAKNKSKASAENGGSRSQQRSVSWRAWIAGEPNESGYYLATTVTPSGHRSVSELWYNPTGGGGRKWWRTRGYLGERGCGMEGAITHKVVAWMPMPEPSQAS